MESNVDLAAVALGDGPRHCFGDQFNVYICDHYVIPDLDAAQLEELRNGKRILDRLTKQCIGEHLEFSVWIAPDEATARSVEHELRGVGLNDKRPSLNPR